MNRKDFGQLVAALRREHLDDEGKQWTQERLALEAEVDLDVLGNIERGKRVLLKSEVLLSLATALRLTNEERKEFFLAAHQFDEQEAVSQATDLDATHHQLVERVAHASLPCYLIDVYCDILSCNQIVLNLLGLTPEHLRVTDDHPITAANMMRFVFSPAFDQREIIANWHQYAYQNITIFRTLSLRYRNSSYFQRLITELRKWPLFRRYWFKLYDDVDRDPVIDNETIVSNTPQWGALSYFSASVTAMTTAGPLVLYVYVPADQATTEVFARIAATTERVAHTFGSWPEKLH
jgi:transcriptional regulator with XRE-family HTH domain